MYNAPIIYSVSIYKWLACLKFSHFGVSLDIKIAVRSHAMLTPSSVSGINLLYEQSESKMTSKALFPLPT